MNNGFCTAFAANFFGEINNIKRAEAQAIRDELKDADFENQKELPDGSPSQT